MNGIVIYPLEKTVALEAACVFLRERGIRVAAEADESVTHLLLPIPQHDEQALQRILPQVGSVTLVSGNLLLRDARYLAENAAITADCAIRLAGQQLQTVFRGCPVLVMGWGRIGKNLADQLRSMGADVAVTARKEADLAVLSSLGFHAVHIESLTPFLPRYRIIFNTAPAPVLSAKDLGHCRDDCIKIDLASKKGMDGADVLWARGLPGKMAPEAAGQLIGRTLLRLIREGKMV